MEQISFVHQIEIYDGESGIWDGVLFLFALKERLSTVRFYTLGMIS
jgi:hypothetical protein